MYIGIQELTKGEEYIVDQIQDQERLLRIRLTGIMPFHLYDSLMR